MRTLFIVGVALGFAAVLAAARFAPWLDPVRLPSHTTVVANGGRAETFVIRLPADRIAAAGSEAAGLRADAEASAALVSALGSAEVLVEQFKVRDREGQVIGIAARHWAPADGAAGAGWSGELRVEFPRAPSSGRVQGGTHEFAGLEGTYTETWTITGVDESGELRGTIELDTVVARQT